MMTRWRIAGEGVVVFSAAIAVVRLWRSGALLTPADAMWLIPLTWITAAVLATWPLPAASRDLFTADQWAGSSLSVTMSQLLLVSVVALPLFIAADAVHEGWWRGRSITFSWPESWWRMVFYQIVYVGFPEELFFRGYLQQRFDDAFGRPWRLWGASWGAGLPLAALLFAVGHLAVTGETGRLSVFFPGLLFGWLQARTSALLAPMLFHAACNITFLTLQN
jgi:membrane protease YdiL (CAAX protease family)